jgi:biotin operon repressor
VSDEKRTAAIPYGYCHCGCGFKVAIAQRTNPTYGHVRGQPVRFILGHHARRHGHAGARPSPTYFTWDTMLSRCYRPGTNGYERYGGRGIAVCDRWRTFDNFLADMGERPGDKTLDRINNDGNYEPGNCRWATRSEQEANKKPGLPTKRKDERWQRISEMWDAGWSTFEIADALGTSRQALADAMSAMRKAGWSLKNPKAAEIVERRRVIGEMRATGSRNVEIAARLGIPQHTVAGEIYRMRKAGINVPARPRILRAVVQPEGTKR